MRGTNVEITLSNGKNLTLKNYTLKYIFDTMKYKEYSRLISIITFDKDNVSMSQFNEHEKMLFNTMIIERYVDMLKGFVECIDVEYNYDFNEFIIRLDEIEFVVVSTEEFNEIVGVLKQIYCIENNTKENYSELDDDTAALLKEFEEFENRVSEGKPKVTIMSIVESVAVRHNSYNFFNIWDLTMYQVRRTHKRLNYIDYYENTMRAVYAGTIDGKTVKMEEVDWSADK